MKFEKISVEAYQKYLNEHKNPIETVQQLEEKIEYFKINLLFHIEKHLGLPDMIFPSHMMCILKPDLLQRSQPVLK